MRYGWGEVEKGFGADGNSRKRAKSLEAFVSSLEDLSISLGGDQHFTQQGRFLNGTPYNDYWHGNLNAFVYRAGEENRKDTKYLVFDKAQEFEGKDAAVLIGELTQLTKLDFECLQKIASKFRGSEVEFIEKVDKAVPEEGIYDSEYKSSYGIGSGVMRNFLEDGYFD